MKNQKKILYSILIFLSIVCMFLPIAESVDNRAAAMDATIRNEEASVGRAADKLTRENDKVQKAADASKTTMPEDEELLAAINAKAAEIAELEKNIKELDNFIAANTGVASLDAELAAVAQPALEDAEAERAEQKKKLDELTAEKAELDKQLADIQAARAFIQAVETVDEEGNPIDLKAVLQAELDQNPDVFANRESEAAEFMNWKAALDAKRTDLDESKAEGGLSADEEAYVTSALADSDERYVVMIKIVRQQVSINKMAADPAADTAVVEKLQKAQDAVYKQLGKVNKEQAGVNELLAQQEALATGEQIPSVRFALLPNRLSVPDNRTPSINKEIAAKEAEIKAINAEIASLEEIITAANGEGLAEKQAALAAAKAELAEAQNAVKGLKDALKAAEKAKKEIEKEKPDASAEEAAALKGVTASNNDLIVLKRNTETVEKYIKSANSLLELYKSMVTFTQTMMDQAVIDAENGAALKTAYESMAVELEAAIAQAKVVRESINADIAAATTNVTELEATLVEYKAKETSHNSAVTAAQASIDAAKTAIEDNKTKIKELEASIKEMEAFIAAATGKGLEKTNNQKAEQDERLAAATARKAELEAELEAYKAEQDAVSEDQIKDDMYRVNKSGVYPTIFRDYTVAVWLGFAMLLLSLALIWIPGSKLVSKCYTFASFTNLIAVIALAFAVLRLGAIPVAAPYADPSLYGFIVLPLLVLPIAALMVHCSNVTNTKRTMIYVLCIALSILSLLPFWVMVVNATRNSQQIQGGVSLIPSTFLMNNWNILQAKHFDVLLGFKNSAIIAFGSTLLGVYFSALTAYGLTVYKFKGAKLLYAIILGIIMIPGQVTGTGFYMFMFKLEWTNSFLPLVIPSIASASTVFFFKQYLEANFQVSLVEAARIDGAGEFYTYNRIVLPIMVPAMATMGIMAVISSWNNYLTPLMLLPKAEMKTLPMMVKELRGDIYRTEYGSIYLGLTLTALPLMIVYFCFSKYIIAGVAVGGVKE